MKKFLKKNIGLVLLFLVGLSILLYPTVSNIWNEYRAERLVSSYRNVIESDFNTEEYEQMLEAARKYNRGLKNEAVPDAFSVREGTRDEEYEALLNVDGGGMMGFLEIPAIDVTLPIFHYTTEESLQKGAGHLFGSSLPVGGEGTHSIVSAHRGLPSAELFTDLSLLEEGDVFYYHILGETMAYETDQILTVLPKEVGALGIEEGKDYSTLMTCTPYGVNSHRLLVRGHRVPFVEEAYEAERGRTVKRDTVHLLMQLLCAVLGFLTALAVVFVAGRRGRKKGKRKG